MTNDEGSDSNRLWWTPILQVCTSVREKKRKAQPGRIVPYDNRTGYALTD